MRYAVGLVRAVMRRRPSPKVAIIGAGFGGLGTAVALRRAGIDDLMIIEADHGVGGTWRRNTYPGAACDIQSHLYSFSFAPNKLWSRTYARQPEILAYLESVVDDFDLRRHIMFGTRVHAIRWNADTWQWDCQVERTGHTVNLSADVVVCAVGLFGSLKLPDIPGMNDFGGTVMHTAQWDHSIDLAGKKVAVVGTGASGVQVVPELAKIAERVTVLQRTPPWMVPQGRPSLQRNRIGAIPAQPAGHSPHALADLEVPARQHRDFRRRPDCHRPHADRDLFPGANRGRRAASRSADTGLSVPV